MAERDEPQGRDLERRAGDVVDDQRSTSSTHRHMSLRASLQSSEYVSQLPAPPEDAEAWARLVPDAPERLLAASEREQAHRHDIEDRAIALDEGAMPRYYDGQRRAHLISLTLGTFYLGLMLAIVLLGQPVVGAVGAGAGVAAIVWAVRRNPNGPQVPTNETPSAPAGDAPPDLPPPNADGDAGQLPADNDARA